MIADHAFNIAELVIYNKKGYYKYKQFFNKSNINVKY